MDLSATVAPSLELAASDRIVVGVVAAVALAALAIGFVLLREVLAAGQGTDKMQEIGRAVQEGAAAYLNRQFRTLAIFVVVVFVLLFALPADDIGERIGRSIFFVIGAVFSATIGYLGMWLATRANIRVAAAAREEGGREKATRIAFRTGGVVGMFTVGLGLFGAAVVVLVYAGQAPRVLEGFGFGAALLAMFMRVGGGIFTKAADVGADLVGKVEQGIPEDDPRNAATIADNVGDNVGDCAGMAADLFESYAVMLVAALILGTAAFGLQGLLFPLIVPAIGVLTAVIGVYITKAREGEGGLKAINRSFYISAVISAVLCVVAAFTYLPASFADLVNPTDETVDDPDRGPARHRLRRRDHRHRAGRRHPLADRLLHRHRAQARQGRGRVVAHRRGHGDPLGHLDRLRVGRLHRAGDRRRRVRRVPAVGLDRRVAVRGGAGRHRPAHHRRRHRRDGHLRPGQRQRPGHRGDVGRRHGSGRGHPHRARRGREHHQGDHQGHRDRDGRARRDGALRLVPRRHHTARCAWQARRSTTRDRAFSFEVFSPNVLVGVIIGASVVFMFSGLAVNAVTRAAGAIVFEVRRQFRDNPGIMDYSVRPDYSRVVDICTRDSLRELATPGLLAIFAPIAVGFGLGVGPLAGYLAGAIATGTLMAVFLANSGGAWDNGKKLIEDGNHGGKGSPAHEATIIGDTVGDPFKDTAGPAINPLIKVMNLVSVLIAPAIVAMSVGSSANPAVRLTIAAVAVAIIVAAVVVTKRRTTSIADTPAVDPVS